MTIYAVGDIHGYAAELDRALGLIEADGGPGAEIVFLGDYTDRGPDSRGVLDRLIAGRDAGRPWSFVLGNHDRMFLRFLSEGIENDDNIKSGKSWMNRALGGPSTLGSYGLAAERLPAFLNPVNGGRETLASYCTNGTDLSLQELISEARDAVPDAHLQFLSTLPTYIERNGYLFVHAGIRPGRPLERQEEEDLIWIREGWLDFDGALPWLVVHGHTALEHPQHHGNRVNLDGGAGYGRPLVPAAFEDGRVWTLDEGGRTPLEPPA